MEGSLSNLSSAMIFVLQLYYTASCPWQSGNLRVVRVLYSKWNALLCYVLEMESVLRDCSESHYYLTLIYHLIS